jgi:hypothetical protein
MPFSSQGATLSFTGFTAGVTSISVESPQAEIVDMTGLTDAIGVKRMVATGGILSPAKIRVDYIREATSPDPLTFQGTSGTLAISHAALSVSKPAIVESVSTEMAVGDLLRGSISFVATEV